MVVTIFALVMGVVTAFVVTAYRVYGYSWQQTVAINEARKGIEVMVKEIREARTGDDGSYPIKKTENKEFIFYSDIDKDGEIERVRYFLGTAGSGELTQECVTFADGGSCDVDFSGFLNGTLESAEVKVSVEGDFGWKNQEYAEIYVFPEGVHLGDVCRTSCSDCPDSWQGTATFDATDYAGDDSIEFIADASEQVGPWCPHSMKAKFELSWTETLAGGDTDFKKGVINPTGDPIQYPLDQEEIWVLSSYIRNTPPIFKYYDGEGNEIEDYPSRLIDTKLMKVFLIVDINPDRSPLPFELESSVQLRNLKEE